MADTLHQHRFTTGTRCLILISIVIGFLHVPFLQAIVDSLWRYCLDSWMFHSVYFETWFATLCYGIMIPIYPFALHFFTFMDKFKVDPNITYVSTTVFTIVKEAIIYMAPLMLMDTFTVKKYAGVDQLELNMKQADWIQTTRALPKDPPSVIAMLFQLVASIIVFDAMFFFIHLLLHKNAFLYKHVHAHHHHHDNLHAHVTNQLTVTERLTLILSANFALKFFSSHPLTRLVFVLIFVFMLVDIHSGYDLPCGLHRVLPWGIYGGSPHHYKHHTHGKRFYQPFLSYLDVYLCKMSPKNLT